MSVHSNRSAVLAAAGLTMLLAACAGTDDGGYPSLARRPAERVAGTPLPPCAQDRADPRRSCDPGRMTGSAEPVAAATDSPPPAPALPDAGVRSRLSALLAQAQAAHDRFRARQPATQRALAGAGPVASDSWSVAAIALAELESARNDASQALSAIDSIYAQDSLAHPAEPGPDTAAIADARDAAAALVAQEDAALEPMRARLPG